MSVMPEGVSLAMDMHVTYTDNNRSKEGVYLDWTANSVTFIQHILSTSSARTGMAQVQQRDGTLTTANTVGSPYAPAVNLPMSWASAHTASSLIGASDGVAFSPPTEPTTLPDLSTTDLDLGQKFTGNIKSLKMWISELNQDQLESITS